MARTSTRYRLLWPFLVVLTLGYSSGGTGPQTAFLPFYTDKLAHLLYFGLLATLLARIPAKSPAPPSRRVALAAIILTSLYGLIDELIQAGNPHRTFDPADWVADTVGASLAVSLYLFWPAYRVCLETDLRAWARRSRHSPSPSRSP